MRRKKGPVGKEQWEEALSGALTGEKIEYLKRGKLKKCDYRTILSLIGECVTENLNAALSLFGEGSEELAENVYRLQHLTDTVVKVGFFRELGFLEESDRKRLEAVVETAVGNFLSKIEISVENENADIVYHVSALESAAGLKKTA